MTASAPPNLCQRCGAAMDPSRATYDKSGNLICPTCAASTQIAEGDARATSSLVGTAVGVLLGGILSWTCLGMFGILALATLIGGIGWLLAIGRDRALRTRLGGKLIPCVIATVVGTLFAIVPLLGLLGLTTALLKR